MKNKERFCCEGVKKLCSGYDSPLDYRPQSNDLELIGCGFADRQIDFCPSCGAQLEKAPFISSQPDNPDFCCWTMECHANVPDEHAKFEIFYQPWTRRYFFSTATGDWRLVDPEGTIYKEWDFYYCLYCGKKLPESLLDLWIKTV